MMRIHFSPTLIYYQFTIPEFERKYPLDCSISKIIPYIFQVNTSLIKENPAPRILTVSIHLNVTNWKDAEKLWTEKSRFSVFPPNIMSVNPLQMLSKSRVVCSEKRFLASEFQEDVKYTLEQIISYVIFAQRISKTTV